MTEDEIKALVREVIQEELRVEVRTRVNTYATKGITVELQLGGVAVNKSTDSLGRDQ